MEYNRQQRKALLTAARAEMGRQETRKKLQEVSWEVRRGEEEEWSPRTSSSLLLSSNISLGLFWQLSIDRHLSSPSHLLSGVVQADAEVMEWLRRLMTNRQKKKSPSRKEKEAAWKALEQREALCQRLL